MFKTSPTSPTSSDPLMVSFNPLNLPQRRIIRFVVHWSLALAFLAPGLAVFFISVSKLTPAARQKWEGWGADYPGILLLGEVSTMSLDQNAITVRWAVGGWGEGYGYHDDDPTWWPYPGFPSLARNATFILDGEIAWSYDPTYILGSDVYSAANQFTTKHTLNAYTDRSYATLFSATHYVDIGVQAVDFNAMETLTIADMWCNSQSGPALTGWTITSNSWERAGENGTLAISPVYTIRVSLDVDKWKLFYEILMGFMILFGSVVTLISTAHLIRKAWAGNRDVRVVEVLSIPLAVGSIIAALRTAFPPQSDLEVFLNEAIYYPCFVLAVWCVMAGVVATRSMVVEMLRRLRAWGEARHPFEDVTAQNLDQLEKNYHTPKETEAEEELQFRMRSSSTSSPVASRTISMVGTIGSTVWSPEAIENGEGQKLLSRQDTAIMQAT